MPPWRGVQFKHRDDFIFLPFTIKKADHTWMVASFAPYIVTFLTLKLYERVTSRAVVF
jgi:hypothetical protein